MAPPVLCVVEIPCIGNPPMLHAEIARHLDAAAEQDAASGYEFMGVVVRTVAQAIRDGQPKSEYVRKAGVVQERDDQQQFRDGKLEGQRSIIKALRDGASLDDLERTLFHGKQQPGR